MRFSAILVRTSEETVATIPPRLSRSFAWLAHADGPPGSPVIPLHSLDTAIYVIQAYLLPCNHRKACRETKWTIHDRALPTNSKQISLSIEAPLNSGTSCMVRDGKWATTHNSTLFGQEVRPYFLPGSTLVFDTDCFSHFRCQNNKKYIPILWNVLMTHECPDLRMSFNYLTGQNRDNKHALRGKNLPSLLANSASIDRGLRSRSAVTYRNRTASD